ncbi:MAG: sigma-70 family RNA polymerase sigma factor [bacterium]
MSNSRVVYQNWIVDLGRDPLKQGFQNSAFEKPDEQIKEAVSSALKKLNANEQEFIIQFYYMGKSYQEISTQTGRVIYKLEALHKRALKKLEARLQGFVSNRFDIKRGSPILMDTLISICFSIFKVNRTYISVSSQNRNVLFLTK